MRATGTRSGTWPRWAASAAVKALRTSSSRKMAWRDCAPAISAADGPSPPSATAARARLAGAAPRHAARSSKESAERERGKYGGLRHARRSPAIGAPRAARSSSDGAGGCGARQGWGRHLTGQETDGVIARRRLAPLAATRMEAGWLAGEREVESGDGRGVVENDLGSWACQFRAGWRGKFLFGASVLIRIAL
jgi:hypothetical protein